MTDNTQPVVQNTGVPLKQDGTSSGETNKKPSEAPSQLPPSLQGKSPEEIAQMYVGLEKKLGEQSKEVGEVRKLKQDMDIVLEVLYKNPHLYKQVEKEIIEMSGGKVDKKTEGDGEDKKSDDSVAELRKSEQNRVISEFETQFKIKDLSKEKRSELNAQIARELVELRDPEGKKTVKQVLDEIPVSQLGKYLEKSFWLARKSLLTDESSKVTEEDLSSIGSLSASTSKSDSKYGLTESELKTAEKLGVDPEKYAKQKK